MKLSSPGQSYQHSGAPVDLVYTRNALHHLPDFWKAIALHRVAKLLRPGGVLWLQDIVFACDPRDAERVVNEWLDQAAERAEDGWTRSEFEAHRRTEYAPTPGYSNRWGLEIRSADHGALGVYADYTCIKPRTHD
jgi:trans-aconitate methyltransferase